MQRVNAQFCILHVNIMVEYTKGLLDIMHVNPIVDISILVAQTSYNQREFIESLCVSLNCGCNNCACVHIEALCIIAAHIPGQVIELCSTTEEIFITTLLLLLHLILYIFFVLFFSSTTV